MAWRFKLRRFAKHQKIIAQHAEYAASASMAACNSGIHAEARRVHPAAIPQRGQVPDGAMKSGANGQTGSANGKKSVTHKKKSSKIKSGPRTGQPSLRSVLTDLLKK